MRFSAVLFLSVEQVGHLHRRGIEEFGGSLGVRDSNLLESAVMAPQASVDGSPLHATLATMTAALAFGIAKNHPFCGAGRSTSRKRPGG